MNKEENDNQLNDAGAEYSLNKRVSIFASQEDADAFHFQQLAAKNPLQRLHDATELIAKVFSRELSQPRKNLNRIFFRKDEYSS